MGDKVAWNPEDQEYVVWSYWESLKNAIPNMVGRMLGTSEDEEEDNKKENPELHCAVLVVRCV